MEIFVKECDWGDTKRENLCGLLTDTASHINRELRHQFDGQINVENFPKVKKPRIYYRNSTSRTYTINLTAKDRRWSQFSYQFAHEFCHILSDYENLKNNRNKWFHESICELASLFTLRKMGERWPLNPPFINWAYYAPHLTYYAKKIIANARQSSPQDSEFAGWLLSHETQLRGDPYLRDKNCVVATKLLPLFEKHPQGWNAVTRFPTSQSRISKYISEWKLSVAPEDQFFVEQVKKILTGNLEFTGI